MSMLSSQIDSLRETAQAYRDLGNYTMEQMLLGAARTIWDLRDSLQRMGAEVSALAKERRTLCRRIDELCMENERLRQENQSIVMAAYDFGYRNGSVHYELEHCPACKNVADLQEALEENAKLLWLVNDMLACFRIGSERDGVSKQWCYELFDSYTAKLRELGVGADA